MSQNGNPQRPAIRATYNAGQSSQTLIPLHEVNDDDWPTYSPTEAPRNDEFFEEAEKYEDELDYAKGAQRTMTPSGKTRSQTMEMEYDPDSKYYSNPKGQSPRPSLSKKHNMKPTKDFDDAPFAKYGYKYAPPVQQPHASSKTLIDDDEGSVYSYDELPPARKASRTGSYLKDRDYYDEEREAPKPHLPYFSLKAERRCLPRRKFCCFKQFDPIWALIFAGCGLFATAIIAFCMWPRIPTLSLKSANISKFEIKTGNSPGNQTSNVVSAVATAAKFLQAIPVVGTEAGLYGMLGTAILRGPPFKTTQKWDIVGVLKSEIYVDYLIDGMELKTYFPTKDNLIADQYLDIQFILKGRGETELALSLELELGTNNLLSDPVTQVFGSSCGLFPFNTFAQNTSDPDNIRMYYKSKAYPALIKMVKFLGITYAAEVEGYFDIKCPQAQVKKILTIK